MTDRLDKELNFHSTALNLRAFRQQVIASNIANADTPNFKARDVDFREALHGALGGVQGGRPAALALALATTSAAHLPGSSGGPAASLKYRNEEQGSVDGNTVNMDTERSAFAENAVQYEASVTFINGLLRSMQQAVQGS